MMSFNGASKIKLLVVLIFFFTPTTAAIFLPLSFNNKLTTGYLLLILLFSLFWYSRKNIFSMDFQIQKFAVFYLLINIFFAAVVFIVFPSFGMQGKVDIIVKPLATFIVAASALWVVYKGILKSGISIDACIVSLALGITLAATHQIFIFSTMPSLNVYEYRNALYDYSYEVRAEFTGTNIRDLPFPGKASYGVFTTYGGTTVIGPLFSMCAAFFLVLYFYSVRNKKKLLYLIAGSASLVVVFFSASRSSLLGLIVSLAVVPLIVAIARRKILISRSTLFTVLITLFFLLIVFLIYWDPILAIVSSAFTFVNIEAMSGNSRIDLFSNALVFFANYPFGAGYEYVRIANLSTNISLSGSVQFQHNHLHNFYLTNLIEFGIVGFVSWMILLLSVFKHAFLNIRHFKSSRRGALSIALMAALAAACWHMLFATMLMRSDLIYASTFFLFVTLVLVDSANRRKGSVRGAFSNHSGVFRG